MFFLKQNLIYIISILVHFFMFQNKLIAMEKITLNACVDDKGLFPLAVFENGEMKGIKFDLINLAVDKLKKEKLLDIVVNFTPFPWKRCFEDIKNGKFDIIILSSLTKEREEFLDYPEGANQENEPCTFKLRTLCDGYSVVTLAKDSYEFNGDPHLIPQPIRVSFGYSISEQLKELSIPFENSIDSEKSILKMIRDGNGSVIVSTIFAQFTVKYNKEFQGKIKNSKKPYIIRSYYYPIAKKSKLTMEQKKLIWKALADVSNASGAIEKLLEKYKQ